jgi:hypothetical protein
MGSLLQPAEAFSKQRLPNVFSCLSLHLREAWKFVLVRPGNHRVHLNWPGARNPTETAASPFTPRLAQGCEHLPQCAEP